jgi:hypothetical protein
MSATLYMWKIEHKQSTHVVLAYAETVTEATEKIALYIASVNPDPAEVSMMQRYLERIDRPTPVDFSGGVASFQIEALPQQ